MATVATHAWFDEGNWPLRANDEISHHHFEDLRKRMFALRNWGCGRDDTFLAANSQFGGESYASITDPTKIKYYKGEFVGYWEGEIWTNSSDLSYAQWAVVAQPPMEFHRPVRVQVGGVVYKCKKRHISSDDFFADLAAGNWEVDSNVPEGKEWKTYDGGNSYVLEDTGEPWYSIPVWEPKKNFYKLNEWVSSGGGWVLSGPGLYGTAHRYHDFDECQPRRYIYKRVFTDDGEWIGEASWDIPLSKTLPKQTDAVACKKPIKFADTGRVLWLYGDKVGFSASHITNPATAGARIVRKLTDVGAVQGPFQLKASGNLMAGDTWTDVYPTRLRSQYSNGPNILPDDLRSSGDWGPWGQNPKANQSYQSQIEMLCDEVTLHLAADANYKSNWQDATGEDYDSYSDSGWRNYPAITDPLHGENESGFEYLKKKTGDYDWYWDDVYIYRSDEYMRVQEVPASLYGGSVETHIAHYPFPVGTWRRWWKYSLGRPVKPNGVPFMMRAQEAGDPRDGNNFPRSGPETVSCLQVDGGPHSVTFFWPAGTFCQTAPGISEFTNWTGTILSDPAPQDNTFWVAGDKRTECRIGAMIYIGTGSAIAGYATHYVRHVEYDDVNDRTKVKVIDSVAGLDGQTVCGDTRITERHDPVEYDNDGNPVYELRHEILNEMRDVMLSLHTFPTDVSMQSRQFKTWAQWSVTDLSILDRIKETFRNLPRNPDDWPDAAGGDVSYYYYSGPDFSSAWVIGRTANSFGYSETEWRGWFYYDDWDGKYRHQGGPGGGEEGTGTHLNVVAFRFIRPANNEYLKNISSITARINYTSQSIPYMYQEAWMQNQRTGDMQWRYEGSPVKNYRYELQMPLVNPSSSGGWMVLWPEVGPELKYSEQDGVDTFEYGYAPAPISSVGSDSVLITLDYNKIPARVMQRLSSDDRDFWGYHEIEEDWGPIDVLPPIPNPSVWQNEPYAKFTFTNNDLYSYQDVLSISGNNVTYSNSSYSLEAGDKVEFTGSVLPGGILADTVYVIKSMNGTTFDLQRLVDGVLEDVAITSSGTSVKVRKCSYVALSINASIIAGQDVDNHSLPLYRRLYGIGGGAYTTEYQTSRHFSIPDRYLHSREAFFGSNSLSLVNGVNAVSNGYTVRLFVSLPSGYFDDGMDIVISGFDEFQSSRVFRVFEYGNVSGQSYQYIDVKCPWLASGNHLQDSSKHKISRVGVPDDGYSSVQWNGETCKGYTFKPQTRDNAVPVNNATMLDYAVEADVDAPEEYPLELL